MLNDLNSVLKKELKEKEELLGIRINNPLFIFSVDDHTFSRTIARQFFLYTEPNTKFRKLIAHNFKRQKLLRGEHILSSDKINVVLQCRLGDVANIPLNAGGKDYIIIPFSGELFNVDSFERSLETLFR